MPASVTSSRGERPLSFAMVVGGYPPVQQAGMERGCQRLAAALARRGHPVSVLTSAVDGMAPVVEEDGVTVRRVLMPRGPGPLWGLSYRRQVRRWLAALLPEWEVAMCHQLYLHSVEANRIARRHGRRACHLLVAAQRYSDISRLCAVRGGRRLLRTAIDGADALFVLSDQSRRELEAAGADPPMIHDYRYFVDVGVFRPDGADPDRELLSLGRWHPQKNLPLLLEAFGRMAGTTPDISLRMVGAGPDASKLHEWIAALPDSRRVHLEGWSADPRACYRCAWALVMSSDAEGLSNVMIEAMACGTPVVTTDVSGAREALDLRDPRAHPLTPGGWLRGRGGLLVPRADAPALASAMTALVQSPQLRAELAHEARARAVSHFSEEVCVGRFLDVVSAWSRQAGNGPADA